jgi:hypothetical protein
MAPSEILDPREFARLCLYLGHDPEDTADAMAGAEGFGIGSDAARALVELASQDQAVADARYERVLDDVARQAEFNLCHSVDLPVLLVETDDVNAERVVGRAYRAAVALGDSHGLGADELAALITGAFLIEPMRALMIAEAARDDCGC